MMGRKSVALRFLRDGRLRLDSGVTLDRGAAWLTPAEAASASHSADYVLYQWYPHAKDITVDRDRISGLLGRVKANPNDVGARLYVGSGLTILTLQEFH